MSDTLTERELRAWWERRRLAGGLDFDRAVQRLTGTVEDNAMVSDLSDQRVMEREDDLLFHVGTLCLRSGQRALWSQIFYSFLAAEGGMPDEDEFTFLERTTLEARQLLAKAPPKR
jgi:hypothetical protein